MTNEPTTDSAQETRQLTAKLFTKVLGLMEDMESIPKLGTSPVSTGKYKYVRDPEVKEAVREGMIKHKLMWMPGCTDIFQEPSGTKMLHTISKFTVTLIDVETGFTWTEPWLGEALDTSDKGFGKSSTLGMKSLWRTMLLIAEGDDPDGSDYSRDGQGTSEPSEPTAIPDNLGQQVLGFGKKHGDDNIGEVYKTDRSYLDWLASDGFEARGDKAQRAKDFAIAYLKQMESGITTPQQPAQDGKHWTETQDWQAFYTAASALGLNNADVHTALKVESAKNYSGTKGEAWNALVGFATETVIGWPDKSELLKEWFKFLNTLPQAKRPSPAAAVKLVVGDGGNIAEFNDTLAVAMNIVRGKLEL